MAARLKAKTHRGASKRFKRMAGGRIKRKQNNRSHILTKKKTKRKRHLRAVDSVSDADWPKISRLLGK